MTSRERVYRALNHEEADRLPVDIGGLAHYTTMHIDAYKRLKKHYGLGENASIGVFTSQAALVEEEVRRLFGADCYPVISPADDIQACYR
ncbi:MAG: hypothetical protein ACOX4M_00345 [Acetivibrionales bacterium]